MVEMDLTERTGADRVAELLNEEPEIRNHPESLKLTDKSKGEIIFRDVTFQYSQGDVVLDRISLRAP